MFKERKVESLLMSALKDYQGRHYRAPSMRELADVLGWKKSVTHRHVSKLVVEGKLVADMENDRIISKSLRLA